MRSIDRGGLTHVSDMTYMLFMSLVQVVSKHLQIGSTSQNPQREIIEKNLKTTTMFSFIGAQYQQNGRTLHQHCLTRLRSYGSQFVVSLMQIDG